MLVEAWIHLKFLAQCLAYNARLLFPGHSLAQNCPLGLWTESFLDMTTNKVPESPSSWFTDVENALSRTLGWIQIL